MNNQEGYVPPITLSQTYYAVTEYGRVTSKGFIHRELPHGLLIISDIENNEVLERQRTVTYNAHLHVQYFETMRALSLYLYDDAKIQAARKKATTNHD